MTTPPRWVGMVIAALCLVPFAVGAAQMIGDAIAPTKRATLPTCNAIFAANGPAMFSQKGASGEGYTKLCYCVSDGAATPAYQWCSTQFAAGAATTTCTGGSTTVCP